MAFTIDPANKRIVLDVSTVSVQDIYVAWVDWFVTGDNSKYLPAFSSVGGDDLGGGNSIPVYYFLQNGWRVRPMEATQTLTITGNLFVSGGGDPIVPTLGTFNVLVKSVVPVMAQGISTGGTSAADIWAHPARSLTDYSTLWASAEGLTLQGRVELTAAILKNKTVTNPATGLMTVFEDDGTTPMFTAMMYEGVDSSTPYRGQGAQRREALT